MTLRVQKCALKHRAHLAKKTTFPTGDAVFLFQRRNLLTQCFFKATPIIADLVIK